MKKGLSLLLVACLVMSIAAVPALAKEADIPFTDVTKDNWFYNDVKGAYDTGLINGKTDTEYKPNDNMTYAEAIKLAACMHQYVEDGEVTLKNGDPWYQSYVNYAKDNGIISKDYSFNDNASRSGYMEIFANCMDLPIINAIEDGSIPDVKSSAAFAPAVYKLYRAGILTGVDDEHNCNPYDNIKRSEVAAILTRMMDKDARKEFTMGDPDNAPTEKPVLTEKPEPTEKPVKEMSVKALPEEVEAGVGDTVTLKAVVTGGKAPYTYDWEVYSRNVKDEHYSGIKVKYGGYQSIEKEAEMEESFPEVTYDDYSMSFTAPSQSFFDAYSSFRCTVTDSLGTSKTVDFQVKYGGSGEFNELTSDTFLLYVEDIFWITDRGLVVTGRIANGKVKIGDDLKLLKADGTVEAVKVDGIEMFRKTLDQAEKGDNVGLQISGLGSDSAVAKSKVNRGEALVGYNDKIVAARDFDIVLTMKTKAEGGRSTAAAGDGSYQPQAYIGGTDHTVYLENWMYDGEAESWYKDEFKPGETYEYVEVTLKNENDHVVVYPGQTGEIREGGKTVGTFTINAVWDPEWD